ncbi:putative L-type lectin-domain containing receptor kinase S.5 [Camellia lanceoleosa]|uniref:L-type lectin-domain containing receptor kinase S.5 n=1 Tax=Camellia lanceoleosa TaxID=1840588 RepID=A0ACC0I347_9ERIC|nr:putative L-type lectin-domain containing receptor kinase S.5 [Camellia lanceoleosa]
MGLAANLRILAVLLCLAAAQPPISANSLKTFNAKYGAFDDNSLFAKAPALIGPNALQITPDTASNLIPFTNQSGRVLLKQPFKLWKGPNNNSSSSDRVASFNSSFLINIYRINNTPAGEGLAFVLVPDTNLPNNSSGQYLGLTNSTTDGLASNRLIAVEFDTFKQDYDPDDNHVGLNINSVESKKAESLKQSGIQLSPTGAKFYNVWVEYDGVKKTIQVYIIEQPEKDGATPPRPDSRGVEEALHLSRVLDQNSYFGFSASTGNTIELNCVLRWNLTVEYFSDDNGPLIKILLGVGLPVVAVAVAAAVAVAYYCRRKKRSMPINILGALKSLPGTPREFEFKDLKKATNNFDEKNKLGQGGYGVVYKGLLQNEDLEVAVKRFSRGDLKDQDDFLAELMIINRLRHKHLVRLLGWCHKNGKLLLVYDYMPNGSLDKHLFSDSNSKPLRWNLRYNIISGVASAVHYLHNEYDQRVVHRDLKASNIMLDSNFNARLEGREEYVVEEAERVLLLGLACSHPIASERPQTQAIVQIISGSVAVPHVPPFKPAFVWPSMPMGLEDISQA